MHVKGEVRDLCVRFGKFQCFGLLGLLMWWHVCAGDELACLRETLNPAMHPKPQIGMGLRLVPRFGTLFD